MNHWISVWMSDQWILDKHRDDVSTAEDWIKVNDSKAVCNRLNNPHSCIFIRRISNTAIPIKSLWVLDVIMSEQKKRGRHVWHPSLTFHQSLGQSKMAHFSMIVMPKYDHDTCCWSHLVHLGETTEWQIDNSAIRELMVESSCGQYWLQQETLW